MTAGIDLSEGAARAVVVNEHGQVLARGEHASGSAGVAPAAGAAVRRAIAGAGSAVTGLAVAMPFPGEPVPADVAAALSDAAAGAGAPAAVAAGTASALAEHWCGAARGVRFVVTFSVGHHVTSGVLVDGAPWEGAHGFAASVGWLALNPVEREDYRRLGGLEAEVSAGGIVRRLVWRIKSGDRSSVVEQAGGDLNRISADKVFQGARAGDGVSISVIRDTAKYIGMAVSNLATMFDPDAIVLGGMIAASGDMMLEAIKLECTRRLRPQQSDRIQILLSPLGVDAVAIGAARAATRARA
jgi:glucokinase